jgi:hypothetical protein
MRPRERTNRVSHSATTRTLSNPQRLLPPSLLGGPWPRSPHKYRACAPRRGIQRETTRKKPEALARSKGEREGDDDSLGTRGLHRSPVADVTRPRGIFKLWWWLVCLIRALLLFLRPPHCKCAPPRPASSHFHSYLESSDDFGVSNSVLCWSGIANYGVRVSCLRAVSKISAA